MVAALFSWRNAMVEGALILLLLLGLFWRPTRGLYRADDVGSS